jgi:hypothetical protein
VAPPLSHAVATRRHKTLSTSPQQSGAVRAGSCLSVSPPPPPPGLYLTPLTRPTDSPPRSAEKGNRPAIDQRPELMCELRECTMLAVLPPSSPVNSPSPQSPTPSLPENTRAPTRRNSLQPPEAIHVRRRSSFDNGSMASATTAAHLRKAKHSLPL